MFQYIPIQSELFSPYLGRYQSFGLRVLRIHCGQDEEIMLLPDVTTDFSFILRLASILTKKQLDPIHLLDIIEDLL